jgi:RNA polymerase sigma-70 factor (ECF subfamily)
MIGERFPTVLEDARAGDELAFAELWRDLHPALLRYLRVLDERKGEDLAAETWVEVVRGLDRFRGGEPGFRAWVFTIARHRHLDWRRAAARRPVPADDDSGLASLAAADDPAATAETADATDAALRLIARLPREQAEVVMLRVVADLDVGQVAQIVGKRPGTVRVTAHRALRRLAGMLEADELSGGDPQ